MGQLVGAVLMCHAPIVVPDVGGARGDDAAVTTRAMRAAAAQVCAARPDVVVVISPHTPRARHAFTVVDSPRGVVRGTFARFGVPEVGVALPVARALIDALAREGAAVEPIALDRDGGLDHGALVPLAFVVEAGFEGPVLVVGLPMHGRRDALLAFGRALRAAVDGGDARVALVASGDMSHCLAPGAPSGHHPDGARFDRFVASAIASGDLDRAIDVDDNLREHAAEDVVDSLVVARGVLAPGEEHVEQLSYEGPFGVGYLVATLASAAAPTSTRPHRGHA